ncbi:MAG: hypothetical protein FWF96_00550 [Kiritimatiellaeota bacterium]|nr:hypothetical protein [Kiritimatiellota bacterium]
MNKSIPIAASAVFLAAAIGASGMAWHYHGKAAKAELALIREVARHSPGVQQPGASTAAARVTEGVLPQRLRDLEAALADRDEMLQSLDEELQQNRRGRNANANNANPGNAGGRQNFQNNWQDLATTDPQRYADMMAQRDAFRQRMEQAMEDRKSFFDTDPDLSPDMQAAYADARALLDQIQEYMQLMQSPDLTPEERREIMAALREIQDAATPLMERIRNDALAKIAKDGGYDPDQFIVYLDRLFDATTSPNIMVRSGGPGGGGAGGNAAWGGNAPQNNNTPNNRGGGAGNRGAGGGNRNRGGGQ